MAPFSFLSLFGFSLFFLVNMARGLSIFTLSMKQLLVLVGFTVLFFLFVCLFVFCFLGLHLWHMEVPRLAVKLELQLPAYTTATAMQDPTRICDLQYSSWQCRILDPLSKGKDQTCILMELVGFISAEPQRELLYCLLNLYFIYFLSDLYNFLPSVDFVFCLFFFS